MVNKLSSNCYELNKPFTLYDLFLVTNITGDSLVMGGALKELVKDNITDEHFGLDLIFDSMSDIAKYKVFVNNLDVLDKLGFIKLKSTILKPGMKLKDGNSPIVYEIFELEENSLCLFSKPDNDNNGIKVFQVPDKNKCFTFPIGINLDTLINLFDKYNIGDWWISNSY